MTGGGGGVQETADQVQAQKNNVKLYQYYSESYKPFIEANISKIKTDSASPIQANAAKAQVNAETMKGVSNQKPVENAVANTKQMNTASGVDVAAQTTAAGKVKQMQIGQQQNFVDIGRGQQTNAQQGQENIAAQSLNTAIQDKNRDLQDAAQLENSVGSAIGTGAAIYRRSMMTPTAAGDGMAPGMSTGVVAPTPGVDPAIEAWGTSAPNWFGG